MITNVNSPFSYNASKVIDFFFEVNSDINDGNFVLLPNGNMTILFFLSGNLFFNFPKNKHKAIVSCNCSSLLKVAPASKISAIGLQINPIYSYWLTGEAPILTSNIVFDLETFFPSSEIDLVLEQLQESNTLIQRCHILEKYFLSKVERATYPLNIAFAIEHIRNEKGIVSLDHLCQYLNLSGRALRKSFKKNIAISPKEFSKIQRFNNAVQMLKAGKFKTLSEIAYRAGYFDQSHFIKEFKYYAKISPKVFLRKNMGATGFYDYAS